MADEKPKIPSALITGDDQRINDDRQLIFKLASLEQQAAQFRRRYDWEWLVRTLYVRGYHFAQYNRTTNTVIFATRSGVRIPINLVKAHLRAVINQVTSFQPKWEVLPNITNEAAFQNARYSGKLLDYVYDDAQIKRKIKEVVNDALMYSVGIWMFDTDKDGNIVIRRVDPYDLYIDPFVKSPNLNDPDYGAEFVIYTTQVPLDWIKKNKDFENTDQLQADMKFANAEYKQFLLQVIKNSALTNKETNKTKILKQAYLRERDENGDIKMKVVTYCSGMDRPLKVEYLDVPEYPFEIFQGEMNPGDVYAEAWVKHLIPINRVIDALESHIFEYNHFFAKGRWIVDKNSGVKLIVNQNGQIIEKNRGAVVNPVTVPPLPPSPQEQISNMRKYLEDISGAHDVSLGRLPGTIRSGVAIAELRQSDATNQSDLVDNMEDFLSRAGRRILATAARTWNTTKLITTTGLGGNPEYFIAIGESAGKKNKKTFKMGDRELPLAVIGAQNKVKVKVGSWLAYTKEAREEKLKEYYRLGAIDQKTLLEHLEFADIDGIVNRSREEAILQANSGSSAQAVQQEFGIQLDEQSLAESENELMDEGIEQFPHPQDNHQLHIIIHKKGKMNNLREEHIKEHQSLLKWQTIMKSRPMQNATMAGQGAVPTPSPMPPQPGMGGVNFVPPQVGPGLQAPFNSIQPSIIGGPETPGLQPA